MPVEKSAKLSLCLDLRSEDGMGLGCIHLAYVDDAFSKYGLALIFHLAHGAFILLQSLQLSYSSARTKNYTARQEGWIFPTLLKKPHTMFITGLRDFPRLHALVDFRPNLEAEVPLWLLQDHSKA